MLITDSDYIDRGVNYFTRGRVNKAIQMFEKALRIDPRSFEACLNLGMLKQLKGENLKSISFFNKALMINPDSSEALAFLYFQYRKLCLWEYLDFLSSKISVSVYKDLKVGKLPGETPLKNIIRIDDPKQNHLVAKAFSENIKQKIFDDKKTLLTNYKKKNKKKIKLGYFSSNLRDHPVGHLISDLFKYHNRSRFEVYVYSYGQNDDSIWRKNVEKYSDTFKNVINKNYTEIAKLIIKDKIDIFVDLNGFSDDSKLEVAALRPAPVIISYLGFPGSTGADFIDYIVVDKTLVLPKFTKYYSEKLIYMENCYQIQSSTGFGNIKRLLKRPKSRQFTFCAFNSSYKITPEVFKVWMNMLKKVDNSVLWLSVEDNFVKSNLIKEADKKGVGEERIIFLEREPLTEHLKRLSLADLALDTFHYNGGATTSNALRVGVPVVTIQGNSYVSRMSSSLLIAVGLPELITYDLKQYENLAIELAINPKKLNTIRKKLKNNKKMRDLFDTGMFVKNLEKEYEKMWRNFGVGGAFKGLNP